MAKVKKSQSGKKAKSADTAAGVVRPTPALSWKIQQPEYDARVDRIRAEMERRELDALVLFHPIRMAYVSGFFHYSTERPMAIVIPASGGLGALIPLLEQEHIAKSPGVTQVKVYPEYPSGGTKHPLLHLADLLTDLGVNAAGKRIGYDSNGHVDTQGYDGKLLSEAVDGGVTLSPARDIVDKLRAVKSEAELGFIIESCVWGNLAHRLMQEKLALGRNEIDVSHEAALKATRMMVAALGPTYGTSTAPFGCSPVQVVYNAGANTAMPHALQSGTGLRRGDVLVTFAGADVGGYNSELERTMIVGEPNAEFVKHFETMLTLQQAVFDALRPGRALSDVETEVSLVYKELGVESMQRHHSGHSMGLEGHEAPYIDKGDPTVLQENMVFSVEPGIYVPGLAGFRHSDTVVIRKDGCERLTFYPRDLDSLTVRL
jgi:Xaa-Pro dipeptidase